jgi:serine/threonine-protein kinase HipA
VSITAQVSLWGSQIGAVTMPDDRAHAVFQYDPDFVRAGGIEVSPLVMPLRSEPYTFPGLAVESFRGLPGLLADSLPDRFGNALIDAWLARAGRGAASFSAVERLCYIGTRGMGALEFAPEIGGPRAKPDHDLQLGALVGLISDVLTDRRRLAGSLADGDREQAMLDILAVGTSAGGARAKALIAWNHDTQQIRSGQLPIAPGSGFEYWILKFDGVSGNRDKDALDDPLGFGTIEYAYSLMARDAGIQMSECRLLHEDRRRHFMTRRFDRDHAGRKRHMQTLGALAHFDFNAAGAHSYEQAFLVMRRLGLPRVQIEQLFRRMVFNIVARNQDDHVKNISFLMDRAGGWSLAPAYDVTYAYHPSGAWTGQHQMSMSGKRDGFTRADFEECGRVAPLAKGRAVRILDEIRAVVGAWTEYARRAGVAEDHIQRIGPALRIELPVS